MQFQVYRKFTFCLYSFVVHIIGTWYTEYDEKVLYRVISLLESKSQKVERFLQISKLVFELQVELHGN
jgi:hypothetical protein